MIQTPFALSLRRCRAFTLAAASVPWLWACGGGGGGSTPAFPAPSVTAASATSVALGQTVLLTLQGNNLDQGLNVVSAGCTGVVRSTTAPHISSASTAYYSCTASAYGAQSFNVTRASDSTALSSASYSVAGPAVSSASATADTVGQPVLLTLTGTNLDLALTVTSTGCTGLARSTTAPNVSTATTAYYTCTASAFGAQTLAVARALDNVSLTNASYTVVGPVITSATAEAAPIGQQVVLTLQGSRLDLPLTVSSSGCTGIVRSTTAPRISSATTAYYTCTASVAGSQTFVVTRTPDGAVLVNTAFSVLAPSITSSTTSTPRYSQTLLLTLNGTNLDQALNVTSPGCSNITRGTAAPQASTATTAYYTCTVGGVGAQQFAVSRAVDSATVGTVAYTVPTPQVTMTVSNGAGVNGSYVITLAPQQAPITVNNFLAYVNSGFYNGSIMHRSIAGFVLQGGGYDAPLSTTTVPVHKPTNPAIVLEDNVGLSNLRLTLSMARLSTPVDSATSEFFINLVNNDGTGANNLNRTATARGYAVFGSITSGATVVDAMAAAPCAAARVSECLPVPNIVFSSVVQTQ